VNDAWYYSNFYIPSPSTQPDTYTGFSFYLYSTGAPTAAGDGYTGTLSGKWVSFDGTAFSSYNNVVLATLRSRGISNYTSTQDGIIYQVSGSSDVTLNLSGSYTGTNKNPFGVFGIYATQIDSVISSFEVSLDDSNANFISKVLGTGNFQKDRNDVPIFVEERYPTLLNYGYNQGYIRGISSTLTSKSFAKRLFLLGWYQN
jgi:hypothetical protein